MTFLFIKLQEVGIALRRKGCVLLSLICCLVGLSACSDEIPSLDKRAPGILLEPRVRPGVALRPVSPRGIALTKAFEGFVPHLYHDVAGFCTIGYGHLISKGPCTSENSERFQDGITEREGHDLLVEDMRFAQAAVVDAATNWAALTDGQYAALCDFAFNAGGGAFRSSTLLKRVNAEDHKDVPVQFRRWVFADGKPWPGLARRREEEIKLYFNDRPVPRALPVRGYPMGPLSIGEPEG